MVYYLSIINNYKLLSFKLHKKLKELKTIFCIFKIYVFIIWYSLCLNLSKHNCISF